MMSLSCAVSFDEKRPRVKEVCQELLLVLFEIVIQ